MFEPTKKDTPRPETKEKPQQDGRRGAITIKSNLIPNGWAANKLENKYSTEVLALLWKFWAPCQAFQPGDPAERERERERERSGIPRGSDFEGQQDLTVGLPQDLGEQNLHSWRIHTKSCMPQDLGERSSDPTGHHIKPCLIVLESPAETVGQLWFTAGTMALGTAVLGVISWGEPS